MKIGIKARQGPGTAFLAFLLALSLILSLGTPAFASGGLPPHNFLGAVTIGADPAPVGTVVSARVAGEEVAYATVDAVGDYFLQLWAREGDIIHFYVAGTWAAEYGWVHGGVTRLDLAVVIGVVHTLTMAVTGSGTTTPPVGNHTFALGTVVEITATADAGWEFANWTGPVADHLLAATNVTMDADTVVTAYFTVEPVVPPVRHLLTVTVAPVASGNVTLNPLQPTDGYEAGTEVTLTAEAAAGYTFDRWSGNVTGTVSPITLIMDAAMSVTAHFIVPVPPVVVTLAATEVTHNSATLNGNLTYLGTATPVLVSFQWGTSPDDLVYTTSPAEMTAAGTFSAPITGLTAATAYYFRAVAAGDGTVYGDVLSFTTKDVDLVAPTVTITIPVLINLANVADVAISIISDEVGTYTIIVDDIDPDIEPITRSGTVPAGVRLHLDLDLTPLADGPITANALVADAAGNVGAAQPATATKDATAPTVAITSTAADPTNVSPIPITATFSEDVTGFELGDITVVNGTAANFVAVSASEFTFDVTPVAEGVVTVDIAAGAAIDAATNPNVAAPQFTITYDTVAPPITIDPVTTPTNVPTQNITGTTEEGATVVVYVDGVSFDATVDGTTWSVVVTLIEGTNTITATAADAAGNTGTAEATIVLETIPQVISTEPQAAATDVAVDTNISATFSEAMDEPSAEAAFTIDPAVGGAFSWVDNILTFDPAVDLQYETVYTVTIGTGAMDLAGTPMAEAHTWSFTTVAAPPLPVPPTVETSEATVITHSSATLNGDLTDLGTAATVRVSFQWGTTPGALDQTTQSEEMTAIGTFSAAITGLTPDTTYYFRAVAVGHGTAYGQEISFTTVTGDLAEKIAPIPAGGTLELGPGTFTGDVNIDKPITITGTPGETVIHGGIRITPLAGSDVTIENLIITDFIDFGIRIEEVKAGNVFIIRYNVIQGVEGSLVGIKVDKVDAGGSLTIELNNITNNTYGLELAAGVTADAARNWWGDISGPEHAEFNPGGTGNQVVGGQEGFFEPWLTRAFQTAVADAIGYFGFAWVELAKGWNILSTPIALDPAVDTWGEFVALGDGLARHPISPAWRFDAGIQGWVRVTADCVLHPGDAIYVRMAEADTAAILVSPERTVPSRGLYPGWNLIGLSAMENMRANEALASVAEVPGGLIGYRVVVSPPVGFQLPWRYIAGQLDDIPYMEITKGYWVFMLNEGGTLAGFAFTPLRLR